MAMQSLRSASQSDSSAANAAEQVAFKVCLSEYIALRTINPPGHETEGIGFLRDAFRALGLPTREWSANGRPSFAAILPATDGDGRGGAILYHHIDVVPVFENQWTHPQDAFSGAEHDGYIWGRGAIDMKSTGVLQMLAIAKLQASGARRTKSIYFLAAADEEVGATGAISSLREMQDGGLLADASSADVVLNEGGYGVQRAGKDVFLIGTEEKGGAWLQAQHADAHELLERLDRTFALAEKPGPIRARTPVSDCRLATFETPGEQINVLPSLIKFSLACPPAARGQLRAIQAAFDDPYVRRMQASAYVTPAADGFAVSVELKSAGHGALGGDSALTVAARALQNIGLIHAERPIAPPFYRYISTPAVRDLVRNVLDLYVPKWIAGLFQTLAGDRQIALREMGRAIYSERLFRTACSWTGLTIRDGAPASALIDCRLLHSAEYPEGVVWQPDAFIDELRARAGDAGLSISLVKGWNYARSPADSRGFQALRDSILAENPRAVISSFLTPTGSDNAYFRSPRSAESSVAPIASYGFLPTVLGEGLTKTIHGSDERFPTAQIAPSLRIYSDVVSRLAR